VIPVHLENLCQTLLDDKVVKENLQVLPDEVNCSSTSKVIHSIAYIELFQKANNFLKISPLEKFEKFEKFRVSQHAALKNKFSEFFKTFEDKFRDIKPDLKPSVLDFQSSINIPASSATTSSLINNNFNFNNNVQILSPLYNLQNIFLNFKPENSENLNSNYTQQRQTQSQSNLLRNFQGNNNLNNELIRLFNNNYQILNSNNLQNNYFNNNLLNDVCK